MRMLRRCPQIASASARIIASRRLLDEIEAEAKTESSPGRLKAALGKFAGFIASAGQPVLTAAFMLHATKLGLPPSE
jgi:hypothetical protein